MIVGSIGRRESIRGCSDAVTRIYGTRRIGWTLQTRKCDRSIGDLRLCRLLSDCSSMDRCMSDGSSESLSVGRCDAASVSARSQRLMIRRMHFVRTRGIRW